MHGLKTVSCYLLLLKIKICLFETYVLFPFRLPRTNLPRCPDRGPDQLTPTSGQVGPVTVSRKTAIFARMFHCINENLHN